MTELKNCPCCRSANIIPPALHWPDGCVYCRDCGLRANSPDAWNTRADGWQDIADAPELKRVRVAGWQPRSSTCQGYWWHHEDVIFDGKAVDHPEAILWMPIYVPTFPTPTGGDHG